MNVPDLINGGFELGMACAAAVNVVAIRRDRSIKGVHWGTTAWASLWGLFNLFYYPHLQQWLSFVGGCAIVAVNFTWLAYAIAIKRDER